MKWTEYHLGNGEEYDKPVREGMALFGLVAGKTAKTNADTLGLGPHEIGLTLMCQKVGDRWQVKAQIDYENESCQRCVKTSEGETDGTDIGSAKARDWLIRLLLRDMMKEITAYDPGPWGTLRGVRPVKIAHSMLDQGAAPETIITEYVGRYGTTGAKAKLATDIALRQRPFLARPGTVNRSVSLYIAIPYCLTRCLYCSFPSNPLPRDQKQVREFLQALYDDMADTAETIRRHRLRVDTVYIGGGTPTSLGEDVFAELLQRVKEVFIHTPSAEFTVEAGRPDSMSAGKINAMVHCGVNRVSINPQSMQDRTLQLIGRSHTVRDVVDIFHQFRDYKSISINMDVIAGLPGETEKDMIDTMEKIASLAPDNLTVHTLALKRGSELKLAAGAYPLPDEKTTSSMTAIAAKYANQMGMVPYYLYRQKYMTGNLENIGYARPGTECVYNIQIMEERQTIIGLGPAASSKIVDTTSMKLTSCYHPKEVNRYISHLPVYLAQRRRLLDELYGK